MTSRGMVRASRAEMTEDLPRPEVRGVEEARDGLRTFLSGTIGSVKVDKIVVLLFQHGFQNNEPFHHFPFDTKSDDLDQLVDEILQVAEDDIASCGANKISYAVKLPNHNGRKNFYLTTVSNDVEEGRSLADVNDADMIPTLRHIASQQMGHNQALFQVTIGSFGELLKNARKENARLSARVEHLEAERERYIESREAILSQQHDRDMETRKQEKNDFYKSQIVGTAMNAVAPLVNNYVKQKLVPQKATPLEGMMIALASTFEPAQAEKLMQSGVFSPAQLANLLQIFDAIHKSFEQERQGSSVSGPVNGVESNGVPHSVG